MRHQWRKVLTRPSALDWEIGVHDRRQRVFDMFLTEYFARVIHLDISEGEFLFGQPFLVGKFAALSIVSGSLVSSLPCKK